MTTRGSALELGHIGQVMVSPSIALDGFTPNVIHVFYRTVLARHGASKSAPSRVLLHPCVLTPKKDIKSSLPAPLVATAVHCI